VFQDPRTPGRFSFVEVWSESREWFETVSRSKRGKRDDVLVQAGLWVALGRNK
jgi:hypothetical protein